MQARYNRAWFSGKVAVDCRNSTDSLGCLAFLQAKQASAHPVPSRSCARTIFDCDIMFLCRQAPKDEMNYFMSLKTDNNE